MGLRSMIKEKKRWKAHMERVKALPHDYRVVYKEIQNYLFKVGPVELSEDMSLLSGIVDLFEEGAAYGKGVLEITGKDVAAFCDELIKDSKTHADVWQKEAALEVHKAYEKITNKKEGYQDGTSD